MLRRTTCVLVGAITNGPIQVPSGASYCGRLISSDAAVLVARRCRRCASRRRFQHVQERRDRAAVETTTELEVGADLGARHGHRLADVARHQQRAEVRRNGIEAAAGNDPRAACRCVA